MKQSTNPDDIKKTSSSQRTQTAVKSKFKKRNCDECNKRKILDESHQICGVCYKAKTLHKQSGNKVVDDFIKYTQINRNKDAGRMEFASYDQFKDVEFIAEGGFSKIYKAIWIDGPISRWNGKKQEYNRKSQFPVALKRLNNSNNITSKELNEVYNISFFLFDDLISIHIFDKECFFFFFFYL